MNSFEFNKEIFKKRVEEFVKMNSKRTLENATNAQIFRAAASALKEQIIDAWLDTRKKAKEQDVKMVYYMSMEFLMGRAMGNDLINIGALEEVKEALAVRTPLQYEDVHGGLLSGCFSYSAAVFAYSASYTTLCA